jgi:ribosomal-protein-alanine N-acetyltransferase
MLIGTERLLIRPLTRDDLPALVELRADEEVSRYLGGAAMQSPEAIDKRLDFYISCHARHGFGMSALLRKTDGVMIGWGGLQPLEETGEIEVGYGFARAHWGQGLATETAAAWLRYGFERAGLARIVAVAAPENTASRHVMEKLGMKYEKTEPHYGIDCVLYAISRADFAPRAGLYALREGTQI